MDALECQIVDVSKKISGVVNIEVEADAVRNALANFETIYSKMSDLEKKNFFRDFINSVQIYPKPLEDGKMVKEIELKVPFETEGSTAVINIDVNEFASRQS